MPSPDIVAAEETPRGPRSPRVFSIQVRALCEGVASAGVTPSELLTQARVDQTRLGDARSSYSLEEFDRLLVAAVRLTDDPAFGLHWPERAEMLQFDQLTILAATAPTLRTALDCSRRFQSLLASRVEYRFVEHAESCVMDYDALATSEQGLRTRTEFLMGATKRLLAYFGAGRAISRVSLPYARPSYDAEYERIFDAVVEFDRPHARLEFSCACLDRVQPHRDLEMHDTLRHRIESQQRRVLSQLTFAEQTEAVVRAALPHALSMKEAARELEVSERSLRRRLAADNTTYSEVLDRVRRETVETLLSSGRRGTKEVAGALGYTNVSAFYRAFRRWTGDTPGRRRAARAHKD